jgi:hypothetical protein
VLLDESTRLVVTGPQNLRAKASHMVDLAFQFNKLRVCFQEEQIVTQRCPTSRIWMVHFSSGGDSVSNCEDELDLVGEAVDDILRLVLESG